jgi:hypothetical protein
MDKNIDPGKIDLETFIILIILSVSIIAILVAAVSKKLIMVDYFLTRCGIQ